MYKAILFDLDGTLTKSDAGILRCVKEVIEYLSYPALPEEEMRKFIGPPLSYSFKEYCKMSPEDAEKGVTYYRSIYNTKGIFENELYPNILELLKSLHDLGIKVCVATSKSQDSANIVLEHFDLNPLLDFVSGSSPYKTESQKVKLIQKVLNHFDLAPSEVLMIGDTLYDAEGAREAKVDFVGVLYGYGTKEEMESEGAHTFFEDVSSLQAYLTNK